MSEVTQYRRVCRGMDCCGGRPLDGQHNEHGNGHSHGETDIVYQHFYSINRKRNIKNTDGKFLINNRKISERKSRETERERREVESERLLRAVNFLRMIVDSTVSRLVITSSVGQQRFKRTQWKLWRNRRHWQRWRWWWR